MAVCGPHAIPHSIFLGRTLPGPGEVMWTDDDRLKQLAWQEREAERCGRCRQHPDAWTDDNGVELQDPPFEVIDVLCPACELLEEDEDGGKRRPGYHKAFRRVEA